MTYLTKAAPEVGYYIPLPEEAVSLATGKVVPKLFEKWQIRGVTFPNKLGVSPMCTYSADENFEATPFHLAHYGAFALRGAGYIMVEASAVSKEGALSPHDLGIFTDKQAEKLKSVTDFAHTQKQVIGIQIAHGGRKSSLNPPWENRVVRLEENGGWPKEVVAPSPIQFNSDFALPKELSIEEIQSLVKKFGDAAERAIKIGGFDFVEIHAAHGYLLNEFLSKLSNKRTDEYGGSFENRIKFLVQVIIEVRSRIADTVPLFLRLSASDNVDDKDSWEVEDSITLAEIAAGLGVDFIDVSSGGVSAEQSRRTGSGHEYPYIYQDHLARPIKAALGDKALVGGVGGLGINAEVTNKLLEEGAFDVALAASPFLQNPGLVWDFADRLNVDIYIAPQYARYDGRRTKKYQ